MLFNKYSVRKAAYRLCEKQRLRLTIMLESALHVNTLSHLFA